MFLLFSYACLTILSILIVPYLHVAPGWRYMKASHILDFFFSIKPSIYVFFMSVFELFHVCFLTEEIMVLMTGNSSFQ